MDEKATQLQDRLEDGQFFLIERGRSPRTSSAKRAVLALVVLGILLLSSSTTFGVRTSRLDRTESPIITPNLPANPANIMNRLPPSRERCPDFNGLSLPKVQSNTCLSTNVSTVQKFEYNLPLEKSTASRWHFFESARPESHSNFRGMVSVIRGDALQTSDIEVRVIIKSDGEPGLKNVLIESSDLGLSLDYDWNYSEFCTEVQVLVSLRPMPPRILDKLEIRSEVLDITFNQGLNWEVTSLVAHTSQGNFGLRPSTSNERLITYDVTISSCVGNVFGWFPAEGNLEFWNDIGNLDLYLVKYPERFKFESLRIFTFEGNIRVNTDFRNWPAHPMDHVITIGTVAADIFATIPHGSRTMLGTKSDGILRAFVQPFGTSNPHESSELGTFTEDGPNDVYLYSPDPGSLDGYHNPLLNMTSTHMANEQLTVKYPDSWYGTVDAEIKEGLLMFNSSELEKVKKDKGHLKAQRGKDGKSRMKACVGSGRMDIRIGVA